MDTLFINGRILTQDAKHPEVSQMLVSENRIQALGNDLSLPTAPDVRTVDLEGSLVLPGFIDAHVHFLWGGESLLTIPAGEARSKADFIRLVKTYASGREPGLWLRGGGWNEHLFKDTELPHKSWLDEAAPGHPMILQRHDGHSGIASSSALDLAGIDKSTPDPTGGVIDKDVNGEPTGILRDAAMGLVMDLIAQETEMELLHNLEAAQAYLLERGVTAVGDMIYDMNHFRFLQRMARENRLKVRVTAYLPILKWKQIQEELKAGIFENEWFQFKGLKGFCDGSLGSHTALMLEPYEDTPESVGIYDTDWSKPDLVQKNIEQADNAGLQSVVHAIGDRAVREVLDLFEAVITKNGPRDRRFRVEHAQHIHPNDQKRFQELDVIASVQPAHCVDDAVYVDNLLGDRTRYAYPFASLVSRGATLALGSDWPVSPADPINTIHGAIHRANWHAEEALDLQRAIAEHTAGSAYAGFREQDLGSLEPGMLADFVILKPGLEALSRNESAPDDLILAVYSDGKQVFQAS